MQQIKVDSYGIKLMVPKALSYLLKIDNIPCITANILKQEMLSLGADAAVSRDALTGRCKKTDCLLMGTLSQFNRLAGKLNRQPFGLDQMGKEIQFNLNNYQRKCFSLDLNGRKLNLKKRAHIMGVVNLTTDSFSGDGLYKTQYTASANYITDYTKKLIDEGADIIDIGGESSRPGAKPVSLKEELNRIIPVIKKLSKKIKVPISIDTYKPEVARQAMDSGAAIINDITGLRGPRMLKVAARYKAAVVIMHMQGNPRTMQKNPVYVSLIDEISGYFKSAVKRAEDSGIDAKKIIIDPGIGFGKTLKHNLEILKKLKEFKILGKPILIGTSRKSFIGKVLNLQPQQRIFGTVSSCIIAVKNGANIVRTHDVKEVKQALKILEAVNNN